MRIEICFKVVIIQPIEIYYLFISNRIAMVYPENKILYHKNPCKRLDKTNTGEYK